VYIDIQQDAGSGANGRRSRKTEEDAYSQD